MRPDPKSIAEMHWTEKLDDNGEIFYENDHSDMVTSQVPIIPACNFWIGLNEHLQLYHLLVKHSGSTEPYSWRQAAIFRSKKEASITANKYYTIISTREKTFQQVARVFSDCPSAMTNGNVPLYNRPIPVQQEMDAIIRSMAVGIVTKPKESDMGFHIFLRTK